MSTSESTPGNFFGDYFEVDRNYLRAPEAIERIQARTKELDFGMASEPRTGALLQTLAATKPAGRLLELGTGTGMATAWLLAGMDAASTLISVDASEEVQAVARESLGGDPRLNLLTLDGAAFLWRQPKKCYDLVFADAIPGKYEALDEALAIVKVGGYYVIDDMLPQPNWPEGHAEKASALLEQLSNDPRFFMLPLPWSTGIVVLVRKPRPGAALDC
jgi:predicted O-methyltransferase YrrM